jgi:Mn-containing catalase
MHLKPMKVHRDAVEADPLIAIAGGGGVNLFNSMGNAWTADYLKITGELDVDLRSNIAVEARAKIVYERLINFCDDAATKDALQFLMTREITHMRAFSLALESLGRPPFVICRMSTLPESPSIHAESSDLEDTESLQELLVEQLRDILHAEKQLVKALPKMAEAAQSAQLKSSVRAASGRDARASRAAQ